MRILLAHSNRTARMGGGQTFTVNLLREFRRRGLDCQVFWIGVAPTGYGATDPRAGTLAELVEFAADWRPDVVHAGASDWDAGVALVRRVADNLALVVTNHGEVYPGWNSGNCDAIVGCSSWTAAAQQLTTDLPVAAVLNGIDTDRFAPAADGGGGGPPIVAWVGRGAAPEKGLARLAAIAPALRAAGVRIWVADPDGPDKVPLAVADLLRPAAERWAGVAQEEMPKFYRDVAASGGCTISTSPSEGLPLALVEAQACGCPVIAADVRGVNECVDRTRGGILYDYALTPDALATLVVDSLRDAAAMRSRQKACSEHAVANFGLDRMANQYLEIYAAAHERRAGEGVPAAPRRGATGRAGAWSTAQAQHLAMIELAGRGRVDLARKAAWGSLAARPTIYLRPGRFIRLLRSTMPGGRRRTLRGGNRP